MKKILVLGVLTALVFGFTNASEYNGSIDSSNGISTNSLEVTLPCSPSSVTNGSVNSTTCVITCNANYTLSSNQCIAVSAGGGGGGGGGGGSTATTTTTTTTGETIITVIKTLSGEVETVVPTAGDITSSPYSDELNQAYQFAFAHGVTTQNTIQKANMEGALIRSHMAKIMVNYAIQVLGQAQNTGVICAFNDMSRETKEMQFYAKLACQLGIMGIQSNGIPAKSFNPNGTVTRGEFGTVLSRSLYGNLYNDGMPFYKNHLAALKKVGIIKNATASNQELRGNVMLMLMRAAQ